MILYALLFLAWPSVLLGQQESRDVELSIDFGKEHKTQQNFWYLWDEESPGNYFRRRFSEFSSQHELGIVLQTPCLTECEMEFKSDDFPIFTDPIYSDGIRIKNRLQINLEHLRLFPYEITLFVRPEINASYEKNTIQIYRDDFIKIWFDNIKVEPEKGEDSGKEISIPINTLATDRSVSVDLYGEKPFILSAVTFTRFKEINHYTSYINLVDLNRYDLAHIFQGPKGRVQVICAAYYGRDILLGIVDEHNSAHCKVITEDYFFTLRLNKWLEWLPFFKWIPRNHSAEYIPITLRNSYKGHQSSYCRVKLGGGYLFGRIRSTGGCQYIYNEKLAVSETYEILARLKAG